MLWKIIWKWTKTLSGTNVNCKNILRRLQELSNSILKNNSIEIQYENIDSKLLFDVFH